MVEDATEPKVDQLPARVPPEKAWQKLNLPNRIGKGGRGKISWGGSQHSPGGGHEGFYRISGTTRSGKTHLTKLFILDILREVESNPHAKLIVYEPKRELYAWLASLGLKSKINLFCTSDARSVPLDFPKDFRDTKDAMSLALAFFPEDAERHEAAFWGKTLRTIFASVYLAIKEKLGYVDLRLVCLVLEDDELTQAVLRHNPYFVQAQKLTATVGTNFDATVANIRHTIQSRVGEMRLLAAHLDEASKLRPAFSLRRFIQEPNSGILVVSKDSDYGHVQDPMNAVLFHRFTQLLDKEQEHKDRKVFVVVDEFPTLAGDLPCPGAKDMFLRLASRGAIPLVTDQGLSTVKPIYGDDTTAILGQCSNLVVLRQPDVESAKDAANALATERGYEQRETLSYNGEYATITLTDHSYDRTTIPEGKLRKLKLASSERGIKGYASSAMSSSLEPWRFTVSPESVSQIPRRHEAIKEYIELGEETQWLRPLTKEEVKSLTAAPPNRKGPGDGTRD